VSTGAAAPAVPSTPTAPEPEFVLGIDEVLEVYRTALPQGTLLVNGFLCRVQATQDGTCAISKDGTFYYNPKWFRENVTTPARLRDICMHELMHPVLGDLAREENRWTNLAGDAVINSMLYNLKLSDCELQEHTYSATEVPECLLRPNSKPPPEYIGLYGSLYPTLVQGSSGHRIENPLDVQTALQVLMGDNWEDPEYLGSHGVKGKGGGVMQPPPPSSLPQGTGSGQQTQAPPPPLTQAPSATTGGKPIPPEDLSLPSDVMGDLAQKVREIAEEKTGGGDGGEEVSDLIVSVLRVKKSVKTELLRAFQTRSSMNMLRQFFTVQVEQRSMVPTSMSRREAQLMAMGMTPVFFTTRNPAREVLAGMGIDMYIDVSGSVYDALPLMIGVFRQMRGDIKTVNVFSNTVDEIPIDDFIRGKLKSTGGTDFNCVVKHAVEKGYKKVMVFTDGDADATDEMKKLAVEQIPMLGVVYFGSFRNHGNWLEKTYKKTFKLEDLVDIKTEYVAAREDEDDDP
jgi:hypothetical protein